MQKQISKIFLVLTAFLLLPNFANAEDVLLHRNNLVYKGAFRIPKGAKANSANSGALAFQAHSISYRPPTIGAPNGSLYIVNIEQLISELVIPSDIINPKDDIGCPTHSISCLATAEWKQGPMDLTEGNRVYTWDNHAISTAPGENVIWGTLVHGNKLIGSILTTYAAGSDSNGNIGPVYTHFSSNLDWDIASPSSPGFQGLYKLNAYPGDAIKNAGMVGGYMAAIPQSWQGALGGKALTGMIRQSTISNGSYGPTLASFDPDNLSGDNTNSVPANLLVGYPSGGFFFSFVDEPQVRGSMNLGARGAVFPNGSRSVLVFGYTGLGVTGQGDSCYGDNTANITQIKTKNEITAWWAANGNPATYACGSTSININATTGVPASPCCYDAAFSSKGNHSYPYVERVWLYDASDLAAVKAGSKNFDEVLPYEQFDLSSYTINPYRTWDYDTGSWSAITNPNYSYTRNDGPDDLPFAPAHDQIVGAAYDSANQLIYLAQRDSDKPGLEPYSLIHVMEVQTGDTVPPVAPSGLSVQ